MISSKVDAVNAIDSAAAQVDNGIKKAGNIIAEFLISKGGAITKNTEADVNSLLSKVPEGIREQVLMVALLQVAKSVTNFTGGNSSRKAKAYATDDRPLGGFSSFLHSAT